MPLGYLTMFLAGLFTSLSPCLFPVLPAYLMYLAKRVGKSLTVTLSFVTTLCLGLATYALTASVLGQELITKYNLTPSTAATILSTIFLILAVVQLTPAKEIGILASRVALRPKRADVLGAALLGLSFSLLAAPCASGPILALAAQAALGTGSITLLIASFSLGTSLPFILLGVTAQGIGPKLHKSLARSRIIKYGGELNALLLMLYGVISLLSTEDPVYFIDFQIHTLKKIDEILWTIVFIISGLLMLYVEIKANVNSKVRMLTCLLLSAGVLRAMNQYLLSEGRLSDTLEIHANLTWILLCMETSVSLLAFIGWFLAFATGNGRFTRWISLCMAISILEKLIVIIPREYTFITMLSYTVTTLSIGLSFTPLAMLSPILSIGKFVVYTKS
ncbi:MAG: cytochrome c biogenesis protein CcdA [Thermofilaceae archaeon]